MKHAQITMEFILFLLVALVLLGGLTFYARSQQSQQQEDEEYAVLEDFALSLQSEFFSASTMHEGFSRFIDLPEQINQHPYNVFILGQNLYVRQESYEFILPIPPVHGSIAGGDFTIHMEEDGVHIS